MSGERKAYPKEFKLMSVELSNSRSDLTALAKELDIKPSLFEENTSRLASGSERKV